MEKHKGTAECKNGHKWAATWRLIEELLLGGLTSITRVVTPRDCAICRLKWDRVYPEVN